MLQIHKYNDLSMIFLYIPRDKSHDSIGKTSKYTPDIHESYKLVPSFDKIQKTRDTKALQRAINSYLYLVAPSLCIVVVQLYYSSVDTKEKKISRLLARCHRSAAQKKLWRMKRRAIPLILQNSFRSQEA